MTEWDWEIFDSKQFNWCEKHQLWRRICFCGTAPTATCPECEKEFEAKLNAEMDSPSTNAPEV